MGVLCSHPTAKAEAEEVYRMQALDYTTGHQAASLREETVDPNQRASNSLFATLVKAAGSDQTSFKQ